MSNDPWQLLNLIRSSATEREVKAAYARLLKQHRPDSDPEGFQILHAAYTEVLRQLKGRAGRMNFVRERRPAAEPCQPHRPALPPEPQVTGEDFDGSHVESGNFSSRAYESLWKSAAEANTTENSGGISAEKSEPASDDTERSFPSAIVEKESPLMVPGHLVDSFNSLHAACASTNPGMVREAFEMFASAAMQAGHRATFIHRLLKTLVSNDVDFLAHYAPIALLAYYMQDFTDELMPEVMGVWLEGGQDARAVAFSKALAASKQLVINQGTAVMLARLVGCTAFWEPECSAKLLNLAYPHLPQEIRATRLTSIEQMIVVGRLFHGFPPAYKRFWHERLFLYETIPVNWQSDATTAAIDYVVNIRGHTWPGLSVIQRFVPNEVWNDMWTQMGGKVSDKQKESTEEPFRRRVFKLAVITGISFIIGCGPFLLWDEEEDFTRSRRVKPTYLAPAPAPDPPPMRSQPLILRPELLRKAPKLLDETPAPGSTSPFIVPLFSRPEPLHQ